MSTTASGVRQLGEGPLSRFGAFVYTVFTVEALLLLTTAPGLVAMVALARDPANLPLFAACALPAGPAVSAALVALSRPRVPTDLHPAAHFVRAYRANVRAVLAVWVPLLACLTVIGTSLAHPDAAGIPAWWSAILLCIGVLAVLWGVNALVLVSFFTFRARDIARLAGYFLARTPGVTLATACLLVTAAGVVALTSEAVLALLGSVLALMLLAAQRPLIALTTREFTR